MNVLHLITSLFSGAVCTPYVFSSKSAAGEAKLFLYTGLFGVWCSQPISFADLGIQYFAVNQAACSLACCVMVCASDACSALGCRPNKIVLKQSMKSLLGVAGV